MRIHRHTNLYFVHLSDKQFASHREYNFLVFLLWLRLELSKLIEWNEVNATQHKLLTIQKEAISLVFPSW